MSWIQNLKNLLGSTKLPKLERKYYTGGVISASPQIPADAKWFHGLVSESPTDLSISMLEKARHTAADPKRVEYKIDPSIAVEACRDLIRSAYTQCAENLPSTYRMRFQMRVNLRIRTECDARHVGEIDLLKLPRALEIIKTAYGYYRTLYDTESASTKHGEQQKEGEKQNG